MIRASVGETPLSADQKTMKRLRAIVFLGIPLLSGILLFHAALLWEQIESSKITEPLTAMRWLAVPLVIGALVLLRRRRISLYRSRPAVVLWLLVALLHLGVVGDGSSTLLAEPIELMLLGAIVVQFVLPTRNREQQLSVLRLLARQMQSCFPTACVVPEGYSPRPPPSC